MNKIIDFMSRTYLNANHFSKNSFLKRHKEEFLDSKPQIIEVLNNTKFYHGTGAYSYMFDTTKYEGRETGVRHVLDEILTNGLIPQRDLFNDVFGTGTQRTLSITESREYARCYATLFMYEKDKLRYEYGSSLFWGGIMALNMIKIYQPVIHHIDEGITQRNMQDYKKMCEGWSRSFRKDGKYEGKNFLYHLTARSDIKNNYGIIIGIKNMPTIPICYRFLTMSEQRIKTTVNPAEFTHIQAPLKNIEQARIAAKKHNITIPIIPIEFVELINSEMSMNQLLSIPTSGS
jgi:hypothetical protein